MAARLRALFPRLVALTLIWLLATSTLTFAAGTRTMKQKPEPAEPKPQGPKVLVVPDVRGQAYVFAKGMLEDEGFAWRVEGKIDGYSGNLVAVQLPAPGVRVRDNGAPTVVLRLQRNPEYTERGLPENGAPFRGTPLVLAAGERQAPAAAAAPAQPKRASERPVAKPERQTAAPAPKRAEPKPRKPDFDVPGAPPEPLDEMPLTDRARLLAKRLGAQAKPTKSLVGYWLYQHSWIVTGARFGWSNGAGALEILIRVDEDLQARWGIGAKSGAAARAALAEVTSKTR